MNKEILFFGLILLAFISLISAIVTISDKIKAKKGSFRIPEKVLFFLALIGGSLAEYLTMRLIRHKTLHKRFMIGLPIIILFQLIIIILIFFKLYST